MSAALGDQDVGARVQRLVRVVECLHLGDERDSGRMDAIGKRPQITERQT
jgi:hypothetical protein